VRLINLKGELKMTRYTFTTKVEVLETVRRAIQCGVSDIHIVDCSGDEVGYWIDMDLSCILSEEEQKYVTQFVERNSTPWNHNAPHNAEFLGAQPARAGQDY
jgi:hypothetical protein